MKLEQDLFKELEHVFKQFDFEKSKHEKFNIFSVLYKEHDERKFIAALLDPYASHKKSYTYL